MRVLVTGAAGFIGAALVEALLGSGDEVVGIDNLNAYYDVGLKRARIARIEGRAGFRFERLDLADRDGMQRLFASERFDAVVNLAAQAGVRYSVENPFAYIDSNLVGFGHVLEGARRSGVSHVVFASSSSVYGANSVLPFSENDSADHPVSFYAATKKANEVMAHSYAWVHGLACTGLRFFTVYGPWGRPDMSPFLFARAILAGTPIKVFNHGKMQRDFTYVDDIVRGVVRTLRKPPIGGTDPALLVSPATSTAPYRVFNIGNNQPVELMHYISLFEKCLGIKAKLDFQPMQPGDVPATAADVDALDGWVGFRPDTPIDVGVGRFIAWYRAYYRV